MTEDEQFLNSLREDRTSNEDAVFLAALGKKRVTKPPKPAPVPLPTYMPGPGGGVPINLTAGMGFGGGGSGGKGATGTRERELPTIGPRKPWTPSEQSTAEKEARKQMAIAARPPARKAPAKANLLDKGIFWLSNAIAPPDLMHEETTGEALTNFLNVLAMLAPTATIKGAGVILGKVPVVGAKVLPVAERVGVLRKTISNLPAAARIPLSAALEASIAGAYGGAIRTPAAISRRAPEEIPQAALGTAVLGAGVGAGTAALGALARGRLRVPTPEEIRGEAPVEPVRPAEAPRITPSIKGAAPKANTREMVALHESYRSEGWLPKMRGQGEYARYTSAALANKGAKVLESKGYETAIEPHPSNPGYVVYYRRQRPGPAPVSPEQVRMEEAPTPPAPKAAPKAETTEILGKEPWEMRQQEFYEAPRTTEFLDRFLGVRARQLPEVASAETRVEGARRKAIEGGISNWELNNRQLYKESQVRRRLLSAYVKANDELGEIWEAKQRQTQNALHHDIVEAAAAQGKIGEGIKDYPDLQAKYGATVKPSPQAPAAVPADTMVEAIALASPSGKMSKVARKRAEERIRQELFGSKGLERPTTPQPSESEVLRRQAAELRNLAERGMKPRAYRSKAAELEAQAEAIEKTIQIEAQPPKAAPKAEAAKPEAPKGGKLPSGTTGPMDVGQTGRVRIGDMYKIAGVVGGVAVAATGAKKLREVPGAEPEKADETPPFKSGNVYKSLWDLVSVGNYFGYGVFRKAVMPGAPPVSEAIAKKRTFSELVGPTGLVPDIVGDPMTWVPLKVPIEIVGKVGKAAIQNRPARALALRALPFTEKVSALGEKLANATILRQSMETWEGPLGMPVVRRLEREAYQTFLRLQDKGIITARKIEKVAANLLGRINKAGGRDLAEDVASVIDAGLTKGGRPLKSRSAIGLAKKRRLEAIAKDKGDEYAATVRRFAGEWRDFDNALGKGLVEADMLEESTVKMWKGAHLRRVYRRFDEVDSWLDDYAAAEPKKAAQIRAQWESFKRTFSKTRGELDFSAIQQRKEIPKQIRDLLEVKDAATRITVGTQKAADLYARAKLYEDLAHEVAITTENFDALKPVLKNRYGFVPDTINKATGKPIYGKLAGMFVPKNMLYEITATLPKDDVLPLLRKLVSFWKLGKVPLSVATQSRNFITNVVLADVLGEVSPHRVDLYADTLRSMVSRSGKHYDEAVDKAVFMHDTIVAQELRDALKMFEERGNKWDVLKAALAYVPKKAAGIYQFNEQWFKLMVYTGARQRGLPIEEAAKLADEALFNYRKLPRGLDALRRYGAMPFLAFPAKAIPALTKAVVMKTGRVARYPKLLRAVESATPVEVIEEEGRARPPYYDLTHIRVPGKEARYADVGYINPYADVQQAAAGGPIRAVLGKVGPGVIAPFEIALNKSLFTGREIVPREIQQLRPAEGRRIQTEYLAQAIAPSMTPPIPYVLPKGGYGYQGVLGAKTKPTFGEPTGRERSVGERVVYAGGIKLRYPERAQEMKRRKAALTSLKGDLTRAIRELMAERRGKPWRERDAKERDKIILNYRKQVQAVVRGEE